MAQTNYTPISLYYSTTAAAVPTSGNLVAGELALNTVDEKLYFKNSSGTVKLLASNAVTTPVTTIGFGTTGLTPSTATSGAVTVAGTLIVGNGGTGLSAGTSGGVPYFSSTSAMQSSAVLTSNALVLGGGAGAAPAPLASLGTTTTVLHGNAAGAPTFGAVSLTADVSGTLPVANGGTGAATLTANYALLGNGTSALQMIAPGASGNLLTSTGTTWASTTPSGATPAGSTTQVQYNNSGAFGASANFTYASGTLSSLATTSAAYYAQANAGNSFLDGATNSSGARINIDGGTAANGPTIWSYNNARSAYVPFNIGASEHIWKIGSTEYMRLSTLGRLGVNTSTPTLGIFQVAAAASSNSEPNAAAYIKKTYSGYPGQTNGSFGLYVVCEGYNSTIPTESPTAITGIYAESSQGLGYGTTAVRANSLGATYTNSYGVYATAAKGTGNASSYGIYSQATNVAGAAVVYGGYFYATGPCTTTGKNFGLIGDVNSDGVTNIPLEARYVGATVFYVQSNGGIANYSANNTNLSDQNEKKNIALAGNYLDKICAIPVKTYLYIQDKDNEQVNLGVIAQDVEAIAPEFVTETEWVVGSETVDGATTSTTKTRKSIYQTDMMFAIMKSVQELNAKHETLKAEFDAYKASHP